MVQSIIYGLVAKNLTFSMIIQYEMIEIKYQKLKKVIFMLLLHIFKDSVMFDRNAPLPLC
jgi:hypothetical protein